MVKRFKWPDLEDPAGTVEHYPPGARRPVPVHVINLRWAPPPKIKIVNSGARRKE